MCARLRPGVIQLRVLGSNRPTQCILSPRSSNRGPTPKYFLPQQGEHSVVRAALGAYGQQPEVADVVPVTVGHVIGQRGQEVSRLIPGDDHLFRLHVLRHEPDFVTVNLPEPAPCDGRMAGVAARVAEELLLAPVPLDVGIPPPLVLPVQEVRELVRALVGLQNAPAIRFSKMALSD